jgi:sodium/proline symporter
MDMDNSILYSFLGFLALFLFVGLLSMRKRQKSADDYLLASRDINPMFVGLSGAATTASGFGFTGIIGFGYAMGLSGAWFIFGIILGSVLAFSFTARRFRCYSQRRKCVSYSEYLTSGIALKTRALPLVIAFIALAALILYATAQLTAGSKALHVLLGWHYNVGAILGAVIVLLYCWAGGIRASIWTDVTQIVVMYAAMATLMIVALLQIGGFSGLYQSLQNIDPKLVALYPLNNPMGPLLFVLGCVSVGLSYIGFPHVMVRFMTLKNPKDTTKAILWYEGSYAAFYITAYIVALCTRVLVDGADGFDKELALVELSLSLLPDIMVGVILAGIFAGTISTADSLILSCTATLSRDVFSKYKNSYMFLKVSTLLVTLVALSIAIFGSKSVFDLVLFVVAIMGAGFAPLFFVRVMRWPVNEMMALCMMLAGLTASISWRLAGLHKFVFDPLPGIAVAFGVYGIMILLQRLWQRPQE